MTQIRFNVSESAFRQTCEKLADRGGNVLISCLSIKLSKVFTGIHKDIKAEAIEPALRKIVRDRGLETLRNEELLKRALVEELGMPEILEDEVFNEKFSESFKLAISSFMNGFMGAVSNKIFRMLESPGRRLSLNSFSSAVRSVIGDGNTDIVSNAEEFRSRICTALNIKMEETPVQTVNDKNPDGTDDVTDGLTAKRRPGLKSLTGMFNEVYEIASRSGSNNFKTRLALNYQSMLSEIGIETDLQKVVDNINKLDPSVLKEKNHLRKALFVMYDLYGK
jgi:hypothetical protein